MKAHRINTNNEKSQEKSKPCIRMNINGSKLVRGGIGRSTKIGDWANIVHLSKCAK